jgi:ankyrin repeat protein
MNINFTSVIESNNKYNILIFQYVKAEQWDLLLDFILKNNIDYSIRDNSNIYLLEYAINFNKIEIIKALLSKDIRIDVLDENNRSLLYTIIKFSYIEILNLFIEKNKETISLNIFEIKDKEGNIALFYAIKFNNLEIVKLILENSNNFLIKNYAGENALHLAILNNNFEIYKIIIKYINNTNIKTNNNETPLHLAISNKSYEILKYMVENYKKELNFNIRDNIYQYTPLHYLVKKGVDLSLINILEKVIKKFDGNLQDINGNIFFHYFFNNINNNFIKTDVKIYNDIYNILIKIKFNYDLFNIDGDTCLHIIFNNIDIYIENLSSILNNFIKNTNLNLQNLEGNSCFFLLVKNNKWIDLKNLLIEKKLDIFLIDKNNKLMFDYISRDDMESFLDMITNSYLYELKTKGDSVKWIDYWDNRCKNNNISYNELNDTEKELLSNLKINKKEKLCYEIIKKKLIDFIEVFKKYKKVKNEYSYPITKVYPKLIKDYKNTSITTFKGSTLDVLCGLLYLNKKYSTTTFSSFKLINNNIIECKNNICEVIGIEIIWKNNNLKFPNSNFNDLRSLLTINKQQNNYRFFIIPLGIEINIDESLLGHANYIIIDFELLTIERFEPHGSESPYGLNYNSSLLDNTLETKFNSFNLGFKYLTPYTYLPKIGFQLMEIKEKKNDYIGDPNGFCALWCIWWIDIKLANPNINSTILQELLFKEIINNYMSFKKIIRDYSTFITEIRDKLLSKIDSNINFWINDKITNDQIILLNKIILIDIKNIIN